MATILEPPETQTSALPPGPRPLPLVGNILAFRRDQLGYLQALQREYGKMATIYIGKTPIVLLFRPEYVRYVLTENPRNFTSRKVAEGLRQWNISCIYPPVREAKRLSAKDAWEHCSHCLVSHAHK